MMGQYRPPHKSRITMGQALFIVAIIVFAGYTIYKTLNPFQQKLGQIASGSIGETHSGDALIVRNEVPYDAEGVTSINYVAEEGSMVYRGTSICYVYSSGYNQKEINSLQNYREQIKEKHMQLLAVETATDQKMQRLEAEVLERALEVRQLVQGTAGNMTNQEQMLSAAMAARQNYIRQKYAADQALTRLYDDEANQLTRIESWTKQYAATTEGIVSFYSDGYEHTFSSTDFTTFSPAQVRQMIGGFVPEKTTTQKGQTTIFRLVRQNTWNVLMLVSDPAWSPTDGQTYKLHLSGFDDTIVDAQVISSTRAGGELLVRLDIRSDVTPILYMRACQAELGEYVNAMVVPKSALHVYENMDVVIVVNGDKQVIVPIRIVKQDGNNVFIEAIQQGHLYVGQTILLS